MVVLGVELVQMIQQHLRTVIHVSLRLCEHVHGCTNTLTRGSFGDAGLEHVLVAQLLVVISDLEQIRAVFFQLFDGDLFGTDHTREVGFNAIALESTFDGHRGLGFHVLLVVLVLDVCDEDHWLAEADHAILQQRLEELVVVAPLDLRYGSLSHTRSLMNCSYFRMRRDYIFTYSLAV